MFEYCDGKFLMADIFMREGRMGVLYLTKLKSFKKLVKNALQGRGFMVYYNQ